MWGTRVGSEEEMDTVEKQLLKEGYVRVPADTPIENIHVQQFRRKLGFAKIADHVILWRQ